MRVKIFVSLKSGVFDPQGKAIEGSLHTLGYAEVQDVRMGKYFELEWSPEASSRSVKPAESQHPRDVRETAGESSQIEEYRFDQNRGIELDHALGCNCFSGLLR